MKAVQTSEGPVAVANPAIAQLVEAARQESDGDTYSGKRTDPRFSACLPLEITFDLANVSDVQSATMHNVSSSGVAFWMRKKLDLHTPLHLRFWTDDSPGPWIPAKVTHVTNGLRGCLIGARFTG